MTIFENMVRRTPGTTVEIQGFALRFARIARKREVADLAEKLDCDRSYINKIENGTQRRVGAVFFEQLVDELQIPDRRMLLANPHTGSANEAVAS